MAVTYRTYVWIEDGTDTDALVLGGIDPANEAYVIEAAPGYLVQVDA
jgi:hypothetical protein